MFASRVPKRKEWSAIEATPSLRRDPDRLMNQWSRGSLCGFLRGKDQIKVASFSNVQSPLRVTARRHYSHTKTTERVGSVNDKIGSSASGQSYLFSIQTTRCWQRAVTIQLRSSLCTSSQW